MGFGDGLAPFNWVEAQSAQESKHVLVKPRVAAVDNEQRVILCRFHLKLDRRLINGWFRSSRLSPVYLRLCNCMPAYLGTVFCCGKPVKVDAEFSGKKQCSGTTRDHLVGCNLSNDLIDTPACDIAELLVDGSSQLSWYLLAHLLLLSGLGHVRKIGVDIQETTNGRAIEPGAKQPPRGLFLVHPICRCDCD